MSLSSLHAYLRDPTRRRLGTRILRSGEQDGRPFVVLRDTIFYPEGGGQPADHGRITTPDGTVIPVVDTRKGPDGDILHLLDSDSPEPLAAGQAVELTVDWPRRFDHMQQHSAQHLLTAVADRLFGWQTTSFHLGAEVSDIELDTLSIDAAQLQELEDEVARMIRRDVTYLARYVAPEAADDPAIRSRGLPEGHQGPVRLIEINGIDLCACGGTHVRSACELEGLKLLSTDSLRGGTRLVWIAGGRLRRRLAAHEGRNRRLREVLQTGDDELVEVAQLKLEQQKDGKKRLERLEKRWAEAVAEALAGRSGPWTEAHYEDTSAGALGQIARRAVQLNPALAVFLTAEDVKGGSFVLASGAESSADVTASGQAVAPLLDGRGGGKGPFFQGRAGSFEKRDAAVDLLS